MNKLLSLENLRGEIEPLAEDVRRGVPTAVFGVQSSQKYFISSLIDTPFLYVAPDSVSAKIAKEQIEAWCAEEVVYLPAKDDVLFFKKAVSKDNYYARICAINAIRSGAKKIVCEADALTQLFPLYLPVLSFVRGEDYSFSQIAEKLVSMGYVREYSVESKGVFAIRGDIVDVFPINLENPVRLDFFGDTLENIRPYDAATGERLQNLSSVRILSATDAVLEDEDVDEITKQIKNALKSVKGIEAVERAKSIAGDVIAEIESGRADSFILPLLENTGNIGELLPKDFLVIYDETKSIEDKLNSLYKEHIERFTSLESSGEVLSFSKYQFVDPESVVLSLSKHSQLALHTFTTSIRIFNPLSLHTLHFTPMGKYLNAFESLVSDLKSWITSDYRIIIHAGTAERYAKLRETLLDEGLPLIDELPENLSDFQKNIYVDSGRVAFGFVYHGEKIVVIGCEDLFTKPRAERVIKKRRNDLFTAPEIGDYAVHEVHGIGRVIGMKKIETSDAIKEYVALQYNGGETLYVPVERMDVLSKYVGEPDPKLSKIGGQEFDRVKSKVRASLKQMAFSLKQLYAERAAQRGYIFPENVVYMDEFENNFAHEPTADQLSSIEEIKEDMCSHKVMDRLLCGDVGFGKTEVALRAIYLCVLGGKQACLMCPSTVLSEQHFTTAATRFEPFGVKVQLLNRYKTPQQQEQILKDLKEGKIDLIIGTHRLLSKDVQFNDLGLLVLDEEQRFGVEHKEKIKTMKQNVDCLTMTATPIPRTLHMSLSGIRDISTITTPPSERLPVQTYVVEESDSLIRDACIREISRGGQVFILYNRVESIYTFADRVRSLLPEAEISVAHGRMDRTTLENNYFGFYRGEKNVLITTTIIENGIDLPNANTIIVIDADRLGISQLYQLRGRVGRGSRLAHAYFTFKPDKVMTANATERLKAIMQFTELGSGYKIAMRDLEIRGAGNVLGPEQHGFMDKVGYELYSKMLKEELTGQKENVADLEIKATAYIPENYIESSSGRMDAYKQIASIKNAADCNRIMRSLEDGYGALPTEVINLMMIATLKAYASNFDVTKVLVDKCYGRLEFSKVEDLSLKNILGAMEKYKKYCKFDMSKTPSIVFEAKEEAARMMLLMTKFLKFAQLSQ